jgi:hypothetical protein
MVSLADLGIRARAAGQVEQRGACPLCSGDRRDQALGFNVETGVYHCFRCEWRGRAGGETATQPGRSIHLNDPAMAERKRERLRRTWRATVPVRCYLEFRALGAVLDAPPEVLRAHPGLEYFDGTRSLGVLPAMIALFHGVAGHPVTLHVTYLRFNGTGKAAVPSPKKILGVPERGATKGGAIRLYEPKNSHLGVAEGIETTLSLHMIRGIPVWAAFCADNLARMCLPAGLTTLEIGVDMDDNGKGLEAGKLLADRMARFSPTTKTTLILPELDGPGDLNDELRKCSDGY